MRPDLIPLWSNVASSILVLAGVISGVKATRRATDKTAEASFRDSLMKDNAELREYIDRLEAKIEAQGKRIDELEARNRKLEEKNRVLEGKLHALERNTE